jgi:ABC-type branched-subunit amino acid transport system ATPase component
LTALLQLDGVRVAFGGVVALSDLSLEIAVGDIVGIIGPNGAGKSTLLNAVSGFVSLGAGRIVLDGDVELSDLSPAQRARRGVGRTFQTPQMFPGLTVAESLDVVARQGRRRRRKQRQTGAALSATEVLELCGIADVADVRSEHLTSGHRRFAELARALMLSPHLLLLDEPATGLRTNEIHDFGAVLRTLQRNYSIASVLVSHDMQIIYDCCSAVVVVNEGSVLTSGTPTEVRRNPAVIEAYFGEVTVDESR